MIINRSMFVALVVMLCCTAACAQPTCRVYKTFRTTANSTTLLDTIRVADDFPVASATVSRISASPSADNLQLFLLHGAAADSPGSLPTPVALRAGSAGTLVPETAISAAALGEWTLMLRDTQTDVRRQIVLSSWTLELCSTEASVLAAQGPAPLPPLPQMQQMPAISVSVSSNGIQVDLGNTNSSATGDNSTQPEAGMSIRVGSMGGAADAQSQARSLLDLLFPGVAAPTGVLGAVHAVKDAGRAAATTHFGDVLKLVADQSEVYKTFVNKKISDTINGVNTAGTATAGLITNRGSLLGGHDKSLRGFIANLKQYVAAEAKDTVDAVLNSAGQLATLHGSLTGDYKSTAGAVAQLVVAGLSNMGQLYLTTEGAAKTHINNAITAKAAALEAMLDKTIAGLTAAKDSKLTGPVVDLKLQLDVAKLQALAQALDKVDAAVKALPTPSAVVAGKVGLVGSLLQQTRVAELLSTLDDGPVMGALVTKVNTARDMLKKAAPAVAATGGN